VSRPLIGVTTSEMRAPRRTDPEPEGDPPQPEMALGIVYARAVELAGGLPVVLPPLEDDAIAPLVARLAGVCLSGGPDLDPATYGADPHPYLGSVEPSLDAFEVAVARQADALGVPVLGICRGCQALNIARGGTLHQHLPDVAQSAIDHRQTASGRETTHTVDVRDGTRLAEIVGAGELDVNSFHHQGVDRLGHGLEITARSPDGVIEAIEDDRTALFLGVQWHVETLVDRPRHAALFEALVAAAADESVRRRAA
jgi:putative glutamine amidotransferase